MIPLPLLTALLAAAVAGGGAWTYQGARWGKQVAQMELAQSKAALAIRRCRATCF